MINHCIAAFILLAVSLGLPSDAQVQVTKRAHPTPKKINGRQSVPIGLDIIPFENFSAIMSGGPVNEPPKRMYRFRNLVRVDFHDRYHISDLQKRNTWVVHPDRCSVADRPDAATIPFLSYSGVDFRFERVKTDTVETIDGHSAKREDAKLIPKNDNRRPLDISLWKAQDLQGFPIRFEVHPDHGKASTFNFQEVRLEVPDPNLFKLPSSCTDIASGEAVKNSSPKPASKTAPKP